MSSRVCPPGDFLSFPAFPILYPTLPNAQDMKMKGVNLHRYEDETNNPLVSQAF